MHRIYSSAAKMSIYVVVFNLEWLLGMHTCGSKCDKNCEQNKEGTIMFIKFWLNSIGRNSGGAPVLLIGTHKDTVLSGCSDILTKSNVELATSYADIKSAHEIIGDEVMKMKVYENKILNLIPPEQPSSFCAVHASAWLSCVC